MLFIEVAAYGSNTISPDAEHVTFELENGTAAQKLSPHFQSVSHPRHLSVLTSKPLRAPPHPPHPPTTHMSCAWLMDANGSNSSGMYLEWMRYAGWLLTCPVLLMTLVRSTCTRAHARAHAQTHAHAHAHAQP